jgi:hypothetical protein
MTRDAATWIKRATLSGARWHNTANALSSRLDKKEHVCHSSAEGKRARNHGETEITPFLSVANLVRFNKDDDDEDDDDISYLFALLENSSIYLSFPTEKQS